MPVLEALRNITVPDLTVSMGRHEYSDKDANGAQNPDVPGICWSHPRQLSEYEAHSGEWLAFMRIKQENSRHEPATILCIDDEPDGLLPRRLLLESAGHRVVQARSGLEGIRIFQSEKVDAVILDYWMSGMKGTAVASELKRINPNIPIIVLSGMADLPGEASGLVDQWIVKGSTRAEHLLNSINALLERRPT